MFLATLSYLSLSGFGKSYLGWGVFVGEQDAEDCTSCDQVLHFEGVKIWVVSGLVVVQHQVDCVCRAANEDDLEESVP